MYSTGQSSLDLVGQGHCKDKLLQTTDLTTVWLEHTSRPGRTKRDNGHLKVCGVWFQVGAGRSVSGGCTETRILERDLGGGAWNRKFEPVCPV